jgi:hypothetical protein
MQYIVTFEPRTIAARDAYWGPFCTAVEAEHWVDRNKARLGRKLWIIPLEEPED